MLFADDLKLYTSVKSNDDCKLLQANLDKLAQWANDWQLKISSTKCCVLDVGRKMDAVNYYTDGQLLPSVDQVTDLGIILDSKLRFSIHINKIVKNQLREPT